MPRLLLLILLCGAFHHLAAQPGSCVDLIRKVHADVTSGRLGEAEVLLAAGVADPSCEWYILQDKAVVLSWSGRLEEAGNYAARAIASLDKTHAPDDPLLLRPLHMLASVQLQQGQIAAARNSLRRMQKIRIEGPRDSALLHGAAAAVYQAQRYTDQAEAEYKLAISAWEEASPAPTADAAAVLNGLADLYIVSKRNQEAERILARALTIYAQSSDAGPADHIRVLNSQAVLFVSQGFWQKAEDNLRAALAIADRTPGMNGVVLEPLLDNYSRVLRTNHHTKEARTVEARVSSLRSDRQIVDITELR